MDLQIKQEASCTNVSERAICDIYKSLRDWLVKYALDDPALFGGFGALVWYENGMIEPEVMSIMLLFSKSKRFQNWLKSHYPRTVADRAPVFYHVIEYFVRKYIAIEPPKFREGVERSFGAAGDKVKVLLAGYIAVSDVKRHYLSLSHFFLARNLGRTMRYYGHHAHRALFWDRRPYYLRSLFDFSRTLMDRVKCSCFLDSLKNRNTFNYQNVIMHQDYQNNRNRPMKAACRAIKK